MGSSFGFPGSAVGSGHPRLRILDVMTLDRQGLIRVCDDLLSTGMSTVRRDGFLIETLLGFATDGSITTFVSPTDGIDATLTRQHVSDTENVTVVDGRLVDSAELIALDLRRRGIRCVAHLAGGTLPSTSETFVLSTVVWPEEILVRSQIAIWGDQERPRISEGGQYAVSIFDWLVNLLPEPVIL